MASYCAITSQQVLSVSGSWYKATERAVSGSDVDGVFLGNEAHGCAFGLFLMGKASSCVRMNRFSAWKSWELVCMSSTRFRAQLVLARLVLADNNVGLLANVRVQKRAPKIMCATIPSCVEDSHL